MPIYLDAISNVAILARLLSGSSSSSSSSSKQKKTTTVKKVYYSHTVRHNPVREAMIKNTRLLQSIKYNWQLGFDSEDINELAKSLRRPNGKGWASTQLRQVFYATEHYQTLKNRQRQVQRQIKKINKLQQGLNL